MKLTNTQYDRIVRAFDEKKRKAENAAREKTEELYNKYPELSEIDAKIAFYGVKKAKIRLGLSPEKDFDYNELTKKLAYEKKQFFIREGYKEGCIVPEYECPLCSDTGFIENEKCVCFKKAEAKLAGESSNLAGIPDGICFENFSLSFYSENEINESTGISAREAAKKALDYSIEFVKNFGNEFDNICFFGAAGVGKTFLSCCIAKELLLSGHQVLYMTAYDLIRTLENERFRPNEDNILTRDLCFDCELLIIDDLGANTSNSFSDSQLFALLNSRMLFKRPTIISTNLSMSSLRSTYTDRIYSRIISEYKRLYLFGNDIRIQKKLFGGDQR